MAAPKQTTLKLRRREAGLDSHLAKPLDLQLMLKEPDRLLSIYR
ncbi:hypothetical protein [Eubacterium maltosivorans]|nr:hypothetical protein [Eubacterium maltosivorans]